MVKIGLIGYNEGNGHPFSFSAIINGFNDEVMSKCPYPVIYDYLKCRPKEEIGLPDMKVTHIWCPDFAIARNIADCSYISEVVSRYEDMLSSIDAVIIARDDVESHFEIAKFFLENGKFVFVDKPLCVTKDELDYFTPYLYAGKLMSCSGLRYKSEMRTSFYGKLKRENIAYVNAYSVLDWKKYAIHVLEAVTPIMGAEIKAVHPLHCGNNLFAKIDYADNSYLTIQINKLVSYGISATFFGKDGSQHTVVFDDNFGCFKYMLQEFERMIQTNKPVISPEQTIAILNALIKGNEYAY